MPTAAQIASTIRDGHFSRRKKLSETIVLASSAVQGTQLTGTTNETVFATITVPAGAMGPNGWVRVTALTSNNNSGNAKTTRIRFGGIGGTAYHAPAPTTNTTVDAHAIILNRNSESSQCGMQSSGSRYSQSGSALATSAVDTSAETTIVITGQLANGTDNMRLEYYFVELHYRD